MKHLCTFPGVNMTHSHFCPLLRGQAEHLWRKTKHERHQAQLICASHAPSVQPLRFHPVCRSVSYRVTSSLSSAQPSGNAALLALQARGGDWHQPRPFCTISALFLSLAQCLEAQSSAAEDPRSDCLFFLISFLQKNKKYQRCKTGYVTPKYPILLKHFCHENKSELLAKAHFYTSIYAMNNLDIALNHQFAVYYAVQCFVLVPCVQTRNTLQLNTCTGASTSTCK